MDERRPKFEVESDERGWAIKCPDGCVLFDGRIDNRYSFDLVEFSIVADMHSCKSPQLPPGEIIPTERKVR